MRAGIESGGAGSRREVLRAGLAIGLLCGLGGCTLTGSQPPPREFRLTAKTTFDTLPKVNWSLAVARPTASPAVDTSRIAVVRSGVEVEYYADAVWVDRPPAMLQPILVQSFRNSGAIDVVSDDRGAFRPDFVLNPDLVTFQAVQEDGKPPAARVLISSTLIQMPRRIVVGTTDIGRTVDAASNDLIAIAAAYDDALGKVVKRVVEWTLATGQQARTS